MTNRELVDSAVAHLKATKVDYPTWQRNVQRGAYVPKDGSGTEWGKAFSALALVTDPAPAGTLYFDGGFDRGDLSRWIDFHDANMSRIPPGFRVVPNPNGGYMARCDVLGGASTSVSGDASFLWEGGSYSLPWLSDGAETWFLIRVVFPDDTDPRYPGKFVPSVISSGWDTFMEHHSAGLAGYSTCHMVWGSSPPCLMFRPCGGGHPDGATFLNLHEKVDPSNRATSPDKPLQFNHEYKIVTRMVFSPDPAIGYCEWWVDGVQQWAGHTPTLNHRADGTLPGASLQAGLYRGPSRTDQDTIYLADVKAGSTKAIVGA